MLNRLLSLFLKPNCPLCQRSANDVFCDFCQEKILSCQLTCHQIYVKPNFLLFAWGKYDRELKRAIASLKYEERPEIGQILGMWLAKAWLESGNKQKYPHLTIIAIPASAQKIKTRGYNQAELITRGFCQLTGYSLKNNLLIRQKDTEAMFGLNPVERKKNIQQAFAIGKDYPKVKKDRQVLIIDDIYTTGTTVNEAKQILNKAGLKTLGVATVSKA